MFCIIHGRKSSYINFPTRTLLNNIRRAGVVGRDVNHFSGRDMDFLNCNFVTCPVIVSSDAPETKLRGVPLLMGFLSFIC